MERLPEAVPEVDLVRNWIDSLLRLPHHTFTLLTASFLTPGLPLGSVFCFSVLQHRLVCAR